MPLANSAGGEHDVADGSSMKITKLETLFVRPRWLFLKMHTDEGIVGLGEPILEGRSQTCAAAVKEIGRHLIGMDPRMVEHNWQAIYRWQFYREGPVLTSALYSRFSSRGLDDFADKALSAMRKGFGGHDEQRS